MLILSIRKHWKNLIQNAHEYWCLKSLFSFDEKHPLKFYPIHMHCVSISSLDILKWKSSDLFDLLALEIDSRKKSSDCDL